VCLVVCCFLGLFGVFVRLFLGWFVVSGVFRGFDGAELPGVVYGLCPGIGFPLVGVSVLVCGCSLRTQQGARYASANLVLPRPVF
jgi:hypothetical protein